MATSTGQNDSGMFEVNFRDERYLPFEGAGATSTWTLQLDRQDNLQLDFDTRTDVIMHLKYTSRRGSKQFETTRRDKLKGYLKGDPEPITHRLFVIKDEFPAEWHRFIATRTPNACSLLMDWRTGFPISQCRPASRPRSNWHD
ncbi:hypothetical protein IVA80_10305 [Bradyrhizobium sp. 139]|nr:hypothetical protein [Bradyrhizobium sp. 139]